MARTRTSMAAVAVGMALALSGCGQSKDSGAGGSDSGDAGSGDKATPAASLTLEKAPFCDRLDPQAMAQALGSAKPLKLTRHLKPGQKFSPYPRAPKQAARAWTCEYSSLPKAGSIQVNHYASVSGMPYTKDTFATYVKQVTDPKYRDKGATCETGDDPVLGDTTLSAACTKMEKNTKTATGSSYSYGQSFMTYRALIDGSLVICGAGSNSGKNFDQVKSAAKELCAHFLEAVAR